MKEIKTELTLNYNIKDVWKKLSDFSAYSKWNRFITSISGNQVVGTQLRVEISPPGGTNMVFKPVLTRFSQDEEIRWIGSLGFKWLFCGEHYFKLKKIDEHTTLLIHGEIFTGALMPLVLYFLFDKTSAGFHLMNNCLNNELEKQQG